MTLLEITQAVDDGKTVFWSNENYKVKYWPVYGEYFVVCDQHDNASGFGQDYVANCYLRSDIEQTKDEVSS
jgi:hypothetical protein